MFRPFLRVGAKSIERRTFVHSRGLALRSFTFKSSRHVFGRFVGRIGLVGLIGCSSALLLFGNSLREPVYLDAPPSSVDEDVVGRYVFKRVSSGNDVYIMALQLTHQRPFRSRKQS
jgi:hypothetical protein